jgi:hypothetical protein
MSVANFTAAFWSEAKGATEIGVISAGRSGVFGIGPLFIAYFSLTIKCSMLYRSLIYSSLPVAASTLMSTLLPPLYSWMNMVGSSLIPAE